MLRIKIIRLKCFKSLTGVCKNLRHGNHGIEKFFNKLSFFLFFQKKKAEEKKKYLFFFSFFFVSLAKKKRIW